MNLEEIKAAIDRGDVVYWGNKCYRVIQDKLGRYLVKCLPNNCCWGLTHADGVTLNGRPPAFFLATDEDSNWSI